MANAQVDVVVVREHGADDRLAKSLRAQENGSLDRLQFADVARVVHDKAFADKLGPVDDAGILRLFSMARILSHRRTRCNCEHRG